MSKKLSFALVATALSFALAELLLAALDLPRESVHPDPFVGFSKSVPLLVRDRMTGETHTAQKTEVFRTNPSKLIWFNDQSFPVVKRKGVFRIVCLGGSTTYGRPFDDKTSYCQWMRELLPQIDSSRSWEVINAGGVSYASYRIAAVMEEFLDLEVDLFVLYTGQNEFLEWRTYGNVMNGSDTAFSLSRLSSTTRVGRCVQQFTAGLRSLEPTEKRDLLPAEVDEMLNHTIGPANYARDPTWYRGVERHFETNLMRMRSMAKSAGAKLAIIRPVSNLRNCSPFKGGFSDDLDDAQKVQLSDQLDGARLLIGQSDLQGSLELLHRIKEVDPLNPDVDFLRGRCLLMQGKVEKAKSAFQSAIDHDICPLRATTAIKDAIARVASLPDIIHVDAESALQRITLEKLNHQCIGEELFLDHVHPSVRGHGEIARELIRALSQAGVISNAATSEQFANTATKIESGIALEDRCVAFRNLAKVFHWAGKFDLAKARAENALALSETDLESRFILAECLRQERQYDAAIDQYTQLFQIGHYHRALVPFSQLLAEQGHYVAAKAYLLEATLFAEGQKLKDVYLMLGQLHLELGEDELAKECWDLAGQN